MCSADQVLAAVLFSQRHPSVVGLAYLTLPYRKYLGRCMSWSNSAFLSQSTKSSGFLPGYNLMPRMAMMILLLVVPFLVTFYIFLSAFCRRCACTMLY